MNQRVARGSAVALAIGNHLQDGGDRIGLGILRQPDARGKPHPIAQRYREILDLADPAGQLANSLHSGAWLFTPDLV
jgi:hypothetical protein